MIVSSASLAARKGTRYAVAYVAVECLLFSVLPGLSFMDAGLVPVDWFAACAALVRYPAAVALGTIVTAAALGRILVRGTPTLVLARVSALSFLMLTHMLGVSLWFDAGVLLTPSVLLPLVFGLALIASTLTVGRQLNDDTIAIAASLEAPWLSHAVVPGASMLHGVSVYQDQIGVPSRSSGRSSMRR